MSDKENLLSNNPDFVTEVLKPFLTKTEPTDLPETGSQISGNLDPDSFNPYDFLPEEGRAFAGKYGHLRMNEYLQKIGSLVSKAITNAWLTSEERDDYKSIS